MSEAPHDVQGLAAERAERRATKDFSGADELRDRIARLGWSVVDEPGGWRLEPIETSVAATMPLRPQDVGSVLDEPPTADVSIHWVVEGWPDDVRRGIASFRAHAGGRTVQYVVADITGEPDTWGDEVEVVHLDGGTGWGAARNAGLKRSRGRVVLAIDGSVEATGDVFGPLEAALTDPTIGVCGPFGIVTPDLREFDSTDGPEADAIEGYCMAFRREILTAAGLFDEKFRWYRTADIEYSFRIKDLGLRAVVVPVPIERHEHRMWFQTAPAERARWSKRNFYRFLDRWRDRYDLTVSGEPPAHEHDEHHHHEDHGP
jgi:Glycosyltransferase like family 2